MNNINELRITERDELMDAIHECSHAFVIKLFPSIFNIDCITLNPHIFNNHIYTKGWGAGINFSRKRNMITKLFIKYDNIRAILDSRKTKTYIDHLFVLISFAPIIAQTVYIEGFNYLSNYNKNVLNLEGLNINGCQGDISSLNEHVDALDSIITDYSAYYLGILDTLFVFYTNNDKEIWKGIVKLSEELISQKDKTLFEDDINDFFSQNRLNKIFRKIRPLIINGKFNSFFNY